MSETSNDLQATLAGIPDRGRRTREIGAVAKSVLSGRIPVSEVSRVDRLAQDADGVASDLLASVLDEARMASENQAPEGPALLEAVAAIFEASDTAEPFDNGFRLRLAQIYARGGLTPPAFAILSVDGPPPADRPSDGAALPDIGDLIKGLTREIGDDPQQVHAALGEVLAGVPTEVSETIVAMIVSRSDGLAARLGLYWLLSAEPRLRLSAATALLQRLEAGSLPPDVVAVLPTVRNWIPADPARAVLDTAIKRSLRSAGARTAPPKPTVHRVATSLPDGVGAQSLIAVVRSGGRRGIAMVLLKQGHGVKDAFIIPCASATEQKATASRILDEIETVAVTPEHFAAAVSWGLGEAQSLGLTPAAGLIDIAGYFDAEALRPVPLEAGDILAAIGAEDALADLSQAKRRDLIAESETWVDRLGLSDSWFEDTGPLRAAIGRARTDNGREAAVWKHLETRRDWWARHFARTAAILQAETDPDPTLWLSVAAVAQALLDNRSLKRLPVMRDIVDLTLMAMEDRESGDIGPFAGMDGDAADRPGPENGFGLGEDFLAGYFTALAIAPIPSMPGDWLGPLLARVDLPDRSAVQELLDGLTVGANMFNEIVAKGHVIRSVLAQLDDEAFEKWCRGFHTFVEDVPKSWPAQHLSAADKRILGGIADATAAADTADLRKRLPDWIDRRYSLRE